MVKVKLLYRKRLEEEFEKGDWRKGYVRSPFMNAMLRWNVFNQDDRIQLVDKNWDVIVTNYFEHALKENLLDRDDTLIGPVLSGEHYYKYKDKIGKNIILRKTCKGPFKKLNNKNKDFNISHFEIDDEFYHILPCVIDEDILKPFIKQDRKKQVLACTHPNQRINRFKDPSFIDYDRLRILLGKIGLKLRLVGPMSYDDFLEELSESMYYLHPSLIDGFSYNQIHAYCLGVPIINFRTRFNPYIDRPSGIELDLDYDEGKVLKEMVYGGSKHNPMEDDIAMAINISSRQHQYMVWNALSYSKKYYKENWISRFIGIYDSSRN